MDKTRCVFKKQKKTTAYFCKKLYVNAKHMLFDFEIENGCMVFFPCVASTEDSITIFLVSSIVPPNVYEFVFSLVSWCLTLSNTFIKCSF